MAVIRIKSTHPPSQGDFVEIEEEDFDKAKGHQLYEPKEPEATEPKDEPEKQRAKPGPKPKWKLEGLE
jgi:hypothetical protein